MKKMRRAGAVAVLAAVWGCGPAAQAEPGGVAPAGHAEARVPEAVHWTRSSAEHRAIVLQTYRMAASSLVEAADGRSPGTWAVVMDADETLLDNSLFQLRLTRSGREYSEDIWNEWVREEAAPPLPGAVEFTTLVRQLGGRLAIVTNREEVVCPETRRNLVSVGVAADVVLCRGVTSDKNPRFARVVSGSGTGMPPLDVVMYVGDNIRDFPGGSQDLRNAPPAALEELGRTWFVLPNPMYGSWESLPVREAGGFEVGEPLPAPVSGGPLEFGEIHLFARPGEGRPSPGDTISQLISFPPDPQERQRGTVGWPRGT